MIHPGSFLDKTINNTRGKNVNANIKHSQIQEIKRNFTYKKMMTSHPDLNFTAR